MVGPTGGSPVDSRCGSAACPPRSGGDLIYRLPRSDSVDDVAILY